MFGCLWRSSLEAIGSDTFNDVLVLRKSTIAHIVISTYSNSGLLGMMRFQEIIEKDNVRILLERAKKYVLSEVSNTFNAIQIDRLQTIEIV